MMWYWGGGIHWWGWLLGSIGMVAFWALVIWAVWYVVTGRPGDRRQAPRDAKHILAERLARGEIDSDEYRRLLNLIRDDRVATGDGHADTTAGSQR